MSFEKASASIGQELSPLIPSWERRNGMVAYALEVYPEINPETGSLLTLFEILEKALGESLRYGTDKQYGAFITCVGEIDIERLDIERLPVKHYFALFIDEVYSQVGISGVKITKPTSIVLEVHTFLPVRDD